MVREITTGFLAGLSTGVYCLGICLPIFIPLILTSKQNLKSSFRIIIEFSLGRLSGYLLFGGFIGFLGSVIAYKIVHQLVALATLITGLLLIIYSFSFLKFKLKTCKIFFKKVKIPILLGFLTGINVCPPFLASLTYVFNLNNVLKSVIYFTSFFIGTSIYIVPAGLLGFFSDDNLIQKIARVSGLFVGSYFVIRSIIYIGL